MAWIKKETADIKEEKMATEKSSSDSDCSSVDLVEYLVRLKAKEKLAEEKLTEPCQTSVPEQQEQSFPSESSIQSLHLALPPALAV